MTLTDHRAQNYSLIVGLGMTGLSVARYLRAKGVTVVIVDNRARPPALEQCRQQMPDVEVISGDFQPALFVSASQLVVSPGLAITEPVIQQAMEQGVELVGDIELFAREARAPIIAITGSNGKSTVTALVAEMAKQAGLHVAMGGNIGVPALDLLDDAVELYVLELSSFQLETTTSLKPVVSTVLNLSADHMDRYTTFDDYAQAKARIFKDAAHVVVNRDDEKLVRMTAHIDHKTSFGYGQPGACDYGLIEYKAENWLSKGKHKLIPEKDLKLRGRHNLANLLAALAIGEAAAMPVDAMHKAIRNFTGLPHRTQWVADIEGVSWYNDSKGTNVGATLAAIEGLSVGKNIILIAGGQAKEADFSVLIPAVQTRVRHLILIGQDADMIERSLGHVVETRQADSMERAVQFAYESAAPGDCVLLSPACASFDMFNGFEHRGDVFVAAVEALK